MALENDVTSNLTKLPTFLEELMDTKDEVILVHGTKKPELTETFVFNNSELSQYNLTGTPLEVDLDVEVSGIQREHQKHHEDEWLTPINLSQARRFINNWNKNIKDKRSNAVVCICNGADKQHTIAFVSLISDGWFTRTLVCAQGKVPVNYVENNFESMYEFHVKKCELQCPEVETKIDALYEIYGNELNENDLEDNNCNIRSISLGCSWNSFSFDIPEHNAVVNLMLQVGIGHENSSVDHIFQDLTFLKHCLTEYSNIQDIPNAILSLNPKEDLDLFSKINDILFTVKSIQLNVCETKPFTVDHDLNFTDKLWNTLKYCNDIHALEYCFKILFDTIRESDYIKIQISKDDKTTAIGKMIESIFSNKMLIPHLSSKQCLDLLIDLGMQKLKKSYLKIIKSFDLNTAKDYQDKWDNISSGKNQKRSIIADLSLSQETAKWQFLFRTHIVIEFLRLVEENPVTNKVKNLVLGPAYKKYVSVFTPDKEFILEIKKFQELAVPLTHFDVGRLLSRKILCTWKMQLSTHVKLSKWTTTFYYSKNPIIPLSIYTYEDELDETVKEKLYAIRSELDSDKMLLQN